MHKFHHYFRLLFSLSLILLSISDSTSQKDVYQKISLSECYQLAEINFPLVKQLDLIDKTSKLQLANVSKGHLPQWSINGQASYQSEVTSLPITLPNIEIPELDKDQYKIYTDIYLPLTNGRNIKNQKERILTQTSIEQENIGIELQKLKSNVSEIYFSILLLNDKSDLLYLAQNAIDSAKAKVEAGIENDIALPSDLQLLEVESIGIDQEIIQNNHNKLALLQMLSLLTGENITHDTDLVTPDEIIPINQMNRKELELFKLQSQALSLNLVDIKNRMIPHVGLFAQAGYGRPALNFLRNDFSTYAIGGLRLNWNLSQYYTSKNERQVIHLAQLKIDHQREAFLLNTKLQELQQTSEIEKFTSLEAKDHEIVQLRKAIIEVAESQLQHGIISSLDYIKYVTDLKRAEEELAIHKVQRLQAISTYNLTTGN